MTSATNGKWYRDNHNNSLIISGINSPKDPITNRITVIIISLQTDSHNQTQTLIGQRLKSIGKKLNLVG